MIDQPPTPTALLEYVRNRVMSNYRQSLWALLTRRRSSWLYWVAITIALYVLADLLAVGWAAYEAG